MRTSFAALLSGCLALAAPARAETPPANQPVPAAVKRITLLAVREPINYELQNIGGAAGAFGALGGAAQALSNNEHQKAFHAALDQAKIRLGPPLQAALVAALKQDGYEVEVDETQWPVPAADGKRDDYSKIHVAGDAILVVRSLMVGYRSTPFSVHYAPTLIVTLLMLDARTLAHLYVQLIAVGDTLHLRHAVRLPTKSPVRFGTYEDLMAHLDRAAAGIVDNEKAAAARVGADLVH